MAVDNWSKGAVRWQPRQRPGGRIAEMSTGGYDVAVGQRQTGGSQTVAVTVTALTAAVSRGGLGTAQRLSDPAPR